MIGFGSTDISVISIELFDKLVALILRVVVVGYADKLSVNILGFNDSIEGAWIFVDSADEPPLQEIRKTVDIR